MSISMHSASAPVFVKMLTSLSKWLDAAEAHAAAKKFDPTVLLTARLSPDMLPFTKQVQIATDHAKGAIARLAGIEIPKFEDNEASIADLKARVRKTIDFVQSVPAAQVEGSEERDVVLPMRSGTLNLKGEGYLLNFAMPNFYFHVTTAYALLRHNGVELGKADYLGAR